MFIFNLKVQPPHFVERFLSLDKVRRLSRNGPSCFSCNGDLKGLSSHFQPRPHCEQLNFSGMVLSCLKLIRSAVTLYPYLIYGTNPSFLLFFQHSLTLTKVPAGEPTVDGVDNVCWWQKLAGLSVFARKNVGPPLCLCVAQTAGSTKTTVKFTAPPVWRGDGSMWCTARTASSKVPLDCCTASLTLQRAASHWRKDLVQRVIWWYQQQHVSYVRKKGLLHDWV